jgi:integrative and conjugative element protein (TIGR02256 family)
MLSWITLHPEVFAREVEDLAAHYREFHICESALARGALVFFGELLVRPPGGARKHPVALIYPAAFPFEHPAVHPIKKLPNLKGNSRARVDLKPVFFSHRHQMAHGGLCLFQRDARNRPGGDQVTGVDALRRAEQWFCGHHTGRWPPDSADSELESHFEPALDMLVAEVFYTEALGQYGKLYIAGDPRRQTDSGVPTLPPLILTAISKENGVVRLFDARADLERVYPWISGRFWNPLQHAVARAKEEPPEDRTPLVEGSWWALPAEPRPFHNGAQLLEQLSLAKPPEGAWTHALELIAGKIADPALFLGLRYPARRGGFEWLFVMLGRHGLSRQTAVLSVRPSDQRRAFEDAKVGLIRAQRLGRDRLQFRNTGVVPASASDKCIAFIGLGALGSHAAELLGKAGIGRIRLMDPDSINTGNVARHIASVTDFGASKVMVVARRLLGINPYLTFEPGDLVAKSAVASLDGLEEFIEQADLVICTTADDSVEAAVNEIALIRRKPVLYGRVLHRGAIGRVFLVRPGEDACHACLATYAHAGRAGDAVPRDWIDVREDDEGVLVHECGRPVIAGSGIDLSFTSSLIARTALDFLAGTAGASNHWVWTRDASTQIDPRLDRSLATCRLSVPPDADCPICQEPRVRTVVLLPVAADLIREEAARSPRVETGGILLGHIDADRRAIVARATGPGPRAEQSSTRFRRDVEFVQRHVERAASELGDRGQYIGEWHTHPTADTTPSPTDVASLNGISAAPHYLTRSPVMVIVGQPATAGGLAPWSGYTFHLGGRFFPIPISVAAGTRPAKSAENGVPA